MKSYEELSKEAKSLGMNWTFNTIEGLEFAVEFFRPKPRKKYDRIEHLFNYSNECVRCGIYKKNLMLINGKHMKAFGADLNHECDAIIIMQKKYNVDINELIEKFIEYEREKDIYQTKSTRATGSNI